MFADPPVKCVVRIFLASDVLLMSGSPSGPQKFTRAELYERVWAEAMATREGVHPIFKRARRVQTATPSWRAVGKGESQSHERIDRVDAYSTAMAYVGAPATGTLVADAVMLMGTMLRDVRVIDRVLDCAGPSEEWAVRGLLVASGLLGVAPQPAQWISRPECVDAGLLATVVADPSTAREVVRRPAPLLDSGGRHRASVALDSVEAGEWLALVG